MGKADRFRYQAKNEVCSQELRDRKQIRKQQTGSYSSKGNQSP